MYLNVFDVHLIHISELNGEDSKCVRYAMGSSLIFSLLQSTVVLSAFCFYKATTETFRIPVSISLSLLRILQINDIHRFIT